MEEPQEKPDLIGEEYLLLKVLKRKWQEPRWTGPHRVTARTDTTVRLATPVTLIGNRMSMNSHNIISFNSPTPTTHPKEEELS
uniref:Murine leukemia virus integrase C-terminal domain-containing protein n=1 Tax=Takifugu rubripes TaxID=31033 RepID=A0A674PGX5_TAKRU